MKPARARRASLPSILARMTRRVIRSTRVPTSEPLRAPLIKSPSQWPGTVRVATSAGHSAWASNGGSAASIGPPCPRPACLARLTQRRQQCAAQGAAGQHIQAHIDGLDREVFPHVVRIRASKAPGNLLWRTAVGQMLSHLLPQPGFQECAGSPWLLGPDGRQRVCRTGTIGAALRGVAGRLTVLGARPNTLAIVRSEWPWARPTLNVSRSSALMCR